MLILAGISIATLTGENGVLTKASDAKKETTHATVKESILLKQSNYELETVTGDYIGSLLKYLEKEEIIKANAEGIYPINVAKLVGEKLPLGNGTNSSDVYKLEKVAETEKYVVNYYDKNENKTKIVELGINGEKSENTKEPEKMEPTEIYAKTYADGTTIFSSSDYVDSSHGEVTATYLTNQLNYQIGDEPPIWLTISNQGHIGGTSFKKVDIHEKIAPTSTSYWFAETESISGMDNLITNNVTDMSMMFYGDHFVELDLRNFDTSSVTSMSSMFEGVYSETSGWSSGKLERLNLSSFDTKKVTDMTSMFSNCGSLETLDLSSFDINENTNLKNIFANCSKLKTVYVKNEEIGNLLKQNTSLDISFVVK